MKAIRLPSLGLVLLLCLSFCFALDCKAQDSVSTVDFDDGRKLGALFTASGKISVSGGEGPGDTNSSGADGRAARISTHGRFAFYTHNGVVKFDPETADTIRFQIHNPEGKKQRFDFIAVEKDKRAIFWRKVEFDHKGWKNFELPMEWFRWNEGRIPVWEDVGSIGIRGNGGLDFWIDGIEVADRAPDRGPELSAGSLANSIFPNSKTVRTRNEEGIWLITDHQELDLDTLHDHLKEVKDQVLTWVPQWKKNSNARPAVLVVAKDRKQYLALFERLGHRYLASVKPPDSSGYHVQGIGFSFFDPKWGTKRPVFTHEFTHSIASSIGKIDFSGAGWFQEGIANYSQTRFHPQQGLDQLIRSGITERETHDQLEKLTTGKEIRITRYWQVMTLFDFLLNDPEMKPKLPELISRFEATGKTNLDLHLESVYEMDFEELSTKWKAYVLDHLDHYDADVVEQQ